jgi:hypothetical protein
MISALLGAAATAIVAGVWPFRRGTPDSADTAASDDQAAVDQRDWIYGDGAARKASRDDAVPTQDDGPLDDDEAARNQVLEETKRRAELEARVIVERAEAEARAIVAAADAVPQEPTADGKAIAAPAADQIVRDAEERARTILAEATAAGARVDAEAALAGSLLMEERAKLAAFLKELLEEVEGSVALGPQVLHLDEARERKQGTGATD